MSTANQPKVKVERMQVLRPLYHKLQKCLAKGTHCTQNNLGRKVTPELQQKQDMLFAFLAKQPSEDMCREYIANNASNIAEVMRGNWAANVKSLKNLIK